ncbi:hypothetical protein PSACC_00381 [Paramicrosporidium saccamoebae]|uniref:Peptidase M48 domain-containing protein n=1 Tax=Paramicrosporidium saccamoebae TaxID=1246581 RepID=A0A2H9TPX0_9FUNG|nr:hypothetical protein PSACC_00381 [Paramicrosporidium saccamoebae]
MAAWWIRSRIETLYLVPLITIFSVQSVATICQIVQVYFHVLSSSLDYPNILSASATLFVFPYSLLQLLTLALVVQRRWVARLWKAVQVFSMSSNTMRPAAFAVSWYSLLALCRNPQWVITMVQQNMVLWILEWSFFVLGNAALSLVFLKAISWKRTHLACLLYCSLSTAFFVADIQKGFLPYRFLPPLKLNEKTAEVFYLAARYNFDPQLIRQTNRDYFISFSSHDSDGKKIYISKGIWNRQEKAAAMAYELGRLTHQDAKIEWALSYGKRLISDILMFYCITPEVYAAFGLGDEAVIAAVAIRDAFSASFSTLLRPFYNLFQQSRVYAADEFATLAGYGEYMVSLMMDLPINLTANKFFEVVLLSEPSKKRRKAAILQKMKAL